MLIYFFQSIVLFHYPWTNVYDIQQINSIAEGQTLTFKEGMNEKDPEITV